MSLQTLSRTQVDLSGLLTLLADSLYSTPEVVLRELVQNGHDSCVRRRLEDPAPFEAKVRITTDPARRTLTIEDTGAGLTREEIDRFLATVATGYSGQLRKAGRGNDVIGQFGIGFLSAYAVSETVDLFTCSYQSPNEAWHFHSVGGERYAVSASDARPVGTRVVLRLKEKLAQLADPRVVEARARHYCRLLHVPVSVNGDAELNEVPPWREADLSPLRRRKRSLEFAARFEGTFNPLCTFDVAPREAGASRGVLWIQDGATYGTTDNRNLRVFVRGMLVSDDAKELLPSWAGFVGGVIENDELRPTASRESLQEDQAWNAAREQLREVLIAELGQLAQNDPVVWGLVLSRHNEALLGAALCDERLFGLLGKVLKVPTTAGELTVPAVRARSKGKLHVTVGSDAGSEEVLFRSLGIPVVDGTRYAVLPFVTRHAADRGELVRLGTVEGNAHLFQRVQLEAPQLERARRLFALEGVEVVPSRFQPASLPAVLMVDREAQLKARLEDDAAARRIGSAVLGLARTFTAGISSTSKARLFLNVDSPVVRAVLDGEGAAAEQTAAVVLSMAVLLAGNDGGEGVLTVEGALERLSAGLHGLVARGPA